MLGTSRFVIRHLRTIGALLFVFLYSASISLATPPTTKYSPGDTLDPLCTPGSTNCSVQILPTQTSQTNKLLTTSGSVTSWTDTLTGISLSGATNTLSNIGNASLTNSTISINGTPVALGGSVTNLALTTNPLSQFAATTSSQLAGVITDETGTGSVVYSTSPTLTTPTFTGDSTTGTINGQTISSAANFTGSLAIAGLFSNTGFGTHTFSSGGTGYNELQVRNTTAGTGNGSAFRLGNDASSSILALFADSSILTPAGDHVANGATVRGAGAGGLILSATDASGTISFMTGGTTERMRIDNTGNVGIGTTGPVVKLDVAGNAGFTDWIGGNGSAGTAFQIYGSYNDAGTKSLTIKDGNVGIGTATPARIFTINGGANTARVLLQNTTTGSSIGNGFDIFEDTSGVAGLWNYYNGAMKFATSNLERMRIAADGNVGVGTTTPITKLSLNTYAGSRLAYINGIANTFNANGITVSSNNGDNATIGGGVDLTNISYAVGAYSPVVSFSSISSNGAYNNAYAGIWGVVKGEGTDPNWVRGDLAFGTASVAGIVERMRISDTGNVVIGTTNTSYKLHVSGVSGSGPTTLGVTGNTGGYSNINIEDAQTGGANYGIYSGYPAAGDFTIRENTVDNRLVIKKTTGNVGIGTSAPVNKVHILGTDAAPATSGIAANGSARFGGVGTNLALDMGINTSGSIYSWLQSRDASGYNTSYNLVLNPNGGNVGIGTTTPGATFEVVNAGGALLRLNSTAAGGASMNLQQSGTTRGGLAISGAWEGDSTSDMSIFAETGSQLRFYTNGSANEVMTISTAGNVGIGTTSPGVKLDVAGSIRYRTGDYLYAGSYDRIWSPNVSIGSVGIGNYGSTVISYNVKLTGGVWKSIASGRATAFGGSEGRFAIANTNLFTGADENVTWTDRFVIDATGNVGIGTTSPSAKLAISGGSIVFDTATDRSIGWGGNTSASAAQPLIYSDGNYLALNSKAGSALYLNFDNTNSASTVNFFNGKMVVQQGGNVGIGTINPSALLHVSGANPQAYLQYTGTVGGFETGLHFVDKRDVINASISSNLQDDGIGTAAAHLVFKTANAGTLTERMRIHRNGNVSIGGTVESVGTGVLSLNINAPQYPLLAFISGGVLRAAINGTNETGALNFDTNIYPSDDNLRSIGRSGQRWTAVWATNGTIQTSDIRDKSIMDTPLGLAFITKLNPITYKWNNELTDQSARVHWGLSAQQVKEVSDELGIDFGGWITPGADGRQALAYTEFISPLIQSVKELDIKVQAIPTFEDVSLYAKIETFLRGIAERDEANVDTVNVKKICIDGLCLTRPEIEALMAGETVDPVPAPAPEPTPDPIPDPGSSGDPVPEPAPDPVPDPSPEPDPAPAPEPTPDPVPAQ